MAVYTLIASETTVQQISPTLSYPVEYATIQTSPSGVIASLPLAKIDFDAGTAAPLLTDYANNIELMMRQTGVVAGVGNQTLDENGLIQDNVVFTVSYNPPGSKTGAITTEAVVPTGLLTEGGDPAFEQVVLQQAEAIISAAYKSLVALAGG